MRKLTKANLTEQAKSKEFISFLEQKSYVGGGNGTLLNPYSNEVFSSVIDWKGFLYFGVCKWENGTSKHINLYDGTKVENRDYSNRCKEIYFVEIK